MNILITGSSGFIGKNLMKFLENEGHNIFRLVRKASEVNNKNIFWNIEEEYIDKDKLSNIDAVVHLAGENISSGRWTKEKKKKILDSRVYGTRLISKTLADLEKKPKVFISASAIGYYGDRGNESLDENSTKGNSFLSDVCYQWEKETEIAKQNGIRTINLRIGIVLSKDGGALEKMLLPFKMGLGGILGDGKQYMSWISIDDLINIINFCINKNNINGVLNAVSPNPVTNYDFTKILGKVLNRPAIFPLPKFVGKIIFGKMADELLFSSTKVFPKKLEENNYKFIHYSLKETLENIILNKNLEKQSIHA
ncbi:MAG: hypothetical protein KatS3mg068_1004 [Candidatus Sericytochromatia bacterium]|nr:MAG: hypothetical protein KatS3mg068_1004 [Candidatus Sericytochromatia bacterium]